MPSPIDDLIEAAAQQRPSLLRLAMLSSLAVRIGPALLRALRLRFLPQTDPGLEADLWFSRWVDAGDDEGFTLLPELAAALRQRLAASGDLAEAWALQQRLHIGLPESVRLQEQLAYLDASAAGADAMAAPLRRALKAMLTNPQRGQQVARWALQALPRLPAAARRLPEARQLRLGSDSRLTSLSSPDGWRAAPLLDAQADRWVLPAQPGDVNVAPLRIRLVREGTALVVVAAGPASGNAPDDESGVLVVPDHARARLQVRITAADGRHLHAALRARAGQRLSLPVEPSDIEITTEAGDVYGFAPLAPSKAATPPTSAASSGLPRFENCRHSVYISFAEADDELTRGWIRDMAHELDEDLRARLARAQNRPSFLPTPMLAHDTVPAEGPLDAQMRERIESAFAMLVVVGENYVRSTWCIAELRMFAERFGRPGLASRLYLFALDSAVMRDLALSPDWRAIFGDHEPVWIDFGGSAPMRPVPVLRDDGRARNQPFLERFDRFVTDLAEKIAADLREPPRAKPTSPPPPEPETEPDAASAQPSPQPVRLYIESSRQEPGAWKLIGEWFRARWQQMLARQPTDQPLAFRVMGLNLDEIDLFNLDDADGVVILWGNKEARTLLSQINMIEDRLTELRPALVAHLSPPQPLASAPLPALSWQVVRFQVHRDAKSQRIEPVADELAEIDSFLVDVLDSASRRRAKGSSTPR